MGPRYLSVPRLVVLSTIVALHLLAAAGCSVVPSFGEATQIAPAFAPPCGADGDCVQLDRCADAGFSTCRGFGARPGIRRETSGVLGSLEFRAQAIENASGAPLSLWHDLPLIVSETPDSMVVNAFFEVSGGTQAKVELNKWEPHNPIWQDRAGVSGQDFERPRYYAWTPAPGNYGALPRTWENVLEPDPFTGFPGDTDPIDVVDVGSAASPLGIAYRVKVIGALGMIDGTDRQTDWKIYVINVEDPRASEIDDISDVPSEVRHQWALFWRFYKSVRGLNENFFYDPDSETGFRADAVWLDASLAREIVKTSARAYQKLVGQCLNRGLTPPYWVPGCVP